MCEPVSMMMAATAASVGGQLIAGKAASQSADFNAKMLRNQAAYEDQQARDAISRGAEDVREVYETGAALRGQARAGYSASNVDLSYGSPLDLMLSNARNIELDATRTGENARREAQGISFGASQMRQNARITKAEGRNAKSAAMIGSVGTVLTGGANIYKYRQSIGKVE